MIIAFGIAGYMLIDGWNLLDSFYMVIITISTVGYTEIHPQSAAGRIFTSVLIVTGVATMLYGFGVFAETLADNAFGNYRRERQLERSLNQLRDHFILCGYGRIGTEIVAEFEHHQVPYAVIDQTGEAVGRLRAEGRLHIEGEHRLSHRVIDNQCLAVVGQRETVGARDLIVNDAGLLSAGGQVIDVHRAARNNRARAGIGEIDAALRVRDQIIRRKERSIGRATIQDDGLPVFAAAADCLAVPFSA